MLAARQMAGRGRQGRRWESPEGNLYLSVLLRPALGAAWAGRLGLTVAVAVAAALAPHAPDLVLKWPNDVLRGEGKLAGILTDAEVAAGGGLAWLVCGVGVNIAQQPTVPGRRVACLDPPAPAPEALADAILAELARWYGRLQREGFAPVRAAWLARAQAPGTPLRLAGPGKAVEGRFAGLGEDGRLLLTDAAGGVLAHGAGELQ